MALIEKGWLHDVFVDTLGMIFVAAANRGRRRAMAEWISVKERLPEHGRDVLMYHDRNGGEIGVGWYAEDRPHWVKDGAMLIANVTHWMPLPEPPGEDGHD